MKTKKLLTDNRGKIITFAIGLAMYSLGNPEESHAFASAEFAIKELCGHMMGNLGALLMTTAGVGAVVSAAFGNFKASYGLIITGVGAFTISAMLSLYFPDAANICNGEGGAGGGNGGVQYGVDGNPAAMAGMARSKNPEIAIATGLTADFSKAAQLPLADEEDSDEPKDQETELNEDLAELAEPF